MPEAILHVQTRTGVGHEQPLQQALGCVRDPYPRGWGGREEQGVGWVFIEQPVGMEGKGGGRGRDRAFRVCLLWAAGKEHGVDECHI